MRKILSLLFLFSILHAENSQTPGIFDVWKSYKFSGNEHFKYTLNNVRGGRNPRTGTYVLDIKKEKDGYFVRLKGQYMFNRGTISGRVESSDSIAPFIMGKTMYSSTFAIFARHILNEMFMKGSVTEKLKWEDGSLVELSFGGGRKIEGDCSFAGYKGKWLITFRHDSIFDKTCISPQVPMPIYMKSFQPGNSYIEFELKEYLKDGQKGKK